MAVFPSISIPQIGTGEETYLPQVRTEFEGGYVQSRKMFTRERGKFSLVWNALPEAEFQTLQAFFVANQGDSFTWTHTITSASMTMRFSGDSISGRVVSPGERSVTLDIEEV